MLYDVYKSVSFLLIFVKNQNV